MIQNKRRRIRIAILLVIAAVGWGWWFTRNQFMPPWLGTEEKARAQHLEPIVKLLAPLQRPVPTPASADWLGQHHEQRQTFLGYLHTRPVHLDEQRKVLYLTTIGNFTAEQKRVADLTAEFMGIYFNVPVKRLDAISADGIPQNQRRIPKARKHEQINSIFLLNEVLKPKLPEDALSLIALTTLDLWPGNEWSFVFGQASLKDRVGVWSMDRFGDPEAGPDASLLVLLRTLKVSSHETGHMLTLPHCVNYHCNMCGSNHLQETDAQPLQLCAECVAKVCWATQANPTDRYQALAEFCLQHGLASDAARYQELRKALESWK